MKRLILFILCTVVFSSVNAQTIAGSEFGFDVIFHASTFGGTAGLGAKYGFRLSDERDHVIVGPSVRYQRSWANTLATGQKSGYNVYGGGAFIHGRFFNALFAGAEFEMLRSPYTSYGTLTFNPTWAPSLLVGGGFSMEFKEKVRLNAGMMYDIINHVNSPLRAQYFMKNSQGMILPVIYRIALFFRLD